MMQKKSASFLQNLSHNLPIKNGSMLLTSVMQANPAPTITSQTSVLGLLKVTYGSEVVDRAVFN